MSAGLRIDPQGLAAHAARISNIADQADLARQAAVSMNLGGGAFGLMCAFLVPPLELISTPAEGFLGAIAEDVRAAANALSWSAQEFADTEKQITNSLYGLADQIGRS